MKRIRVRAARAVGLLLSLSLAVAVLAALSRPAATAVGSCDPNSESIATSAFHTDLAYRWAPFFIQDTADKWNADTLGRIDFDGNWIANDSWEHLPAGGMAPYVYCNVLETSTHWFIYYSTFHARDWNNLWFGNCGPDPDCHENDSENVLVMVQKDGSTFGRFRLMQTKAHYHFYQYAFAGDGVHDGIGPDADDLDNDSERGFALFVDSSVGITSPRPAVYSEAKGHGLCDWWDNNGPACLHPDDKVGTSSNDGIFYYPDRNATPAPPPNPKGGQYYNHKRPYRLLSVWDDLYVLRSCLGNGRHLDKAFTYAGVSGNGVPEIGGALDGDTYGDDAATAYWAQKDADNNLASGDWGIDPARTVQRQLRFDEAVDTVYVYNPFRGIR